MNIPSDEHYAALQAAAPQAQICIAHSEYEAKTLIKDTEVVMGNRYFLQSLPYAQNLRWMQSNSMGVDVILSGAGNQLDGITLTCARGLYADEIADHALALLLGVARGFVDLIDDFRAKRWRRWSLLTLNGRRAMVIGYGATGKAIAKRLMAFGISVAGVRRSHIGEPVVDEDGVVVHSTRSWVGQLPNIDILVLAIPLTDETYQMVGEQEIGALPDDAIIINIARGEVINEEALFDALRQGELYGAGLDTISVEPAPPTHPIWDVPRLLLTPHVARSFETENFRWEGLFVENLRRYVAGEPLLNVVDKIAGY